MKLRDVAVVAVLLSAAESYALITFAPELRPLGGLGRLVERFFLLNIVIYGVYAIFIYPFVLSPLRHLPGPNGGFTGSMVEAAFSQPRGEKIRQWMEKIPNDGLLRFREFFNREALILTSHETLKECLSERAYDYEKKSNVRDLLRRILGDGLIIVEGDEHKFQRKHLIPSFQVKVIRDLYPTFWKKACQLTTMLAKDTTLSETEMGVWCTRVTLDIIGIAGFGQDFNSLVNPEDEFVQQYNEVLEPDKEKLVYFALNMTIPHWAVNLIPFWKIPRHLNNISDNLHAFAYELAKARRAELNDPKVNAATKEGRHDILSLLVKSNDFSDHELAAQVLTMMAAGHETTSSTLSWCLYLLARHPDIQTKVRDEVRASLPSPSSSETITAAVIDALPWLNGVCNETLRLYPTVPLTTREAVRPTVLAGQKIPVGTEIFIAPAAVNRYTRFWGADANEFVPGRWIDHRDDGKVLVNNTGGASNNYDIMTFLHGPRSCIGQGFARSELKCLLAALVGRYEFTTTRDISTYYTAGLVTTKPANGMWMKVTEVPGW